jgi:hypothetical protein
MSERKDDQAGDRTQDLHVSWGMLRRAGSPRMKYLDHAAAEVDPCNTT